jgi:hypothetical protein
MAYEIDKNKGGGSLLRKASSGLQKLAGASRGVAVPHNQFYELEAAEVLQICINEGDTGYRSGLDVGKIKARMVNSEYNTKKEFLQWVYPMSTNLRNYPMIGEYVIIAEYFGKRYYLHTLNKNNSVNSNIFPGLSMSRITGKIGGGNSSQYKSSNASGGGGGGASGIAEAISGMYSTFQPTSGILPTKIYEGDVCLDGKFGQSIRLGYGKNKHEAYNSPNILLRAGQRLASEDPTGVSDGMGFGKPISENINDDGTSVYLLTKETCGIMSATAKDTSNTVHTVSWATPVQGEAITIPTLWDGKQFVVNSDRLIFNSRNNEMFFSALGTQYFCTSNWFISDSMMGTVLNTEGQTVIRNKKNTIINSPEIYLGVPDEGAPALAEGKCEHLVFGETLKTLLEELIDAITKAQYINGMGPASLNPANLPGFMGIKAKLVKILSKQNFTM